MKSYTIPGALLDKESKLMLASVAPFKPGQPLAWANEPHSASSSTLQH